MIYTVVNTAFQLRDRFIEMGRDQYSYAAYVSMFNYLNESEGPVELDVIGLCCDFDELTYDELRNEYSELAEIEDDREVFEKLSDMTVTFELEGRVLFLTF